MVMSC